MKTHTYITTSSAVDGVSAVLSRVAGSVGTDEEAILLAGGRWTAGKDGAGWVFPGRPSLLGRSDEVLVWTPDYPRAADLLAAHDWDVIVHMMDDDIREALHMALAPCSAIDYLAAYLGWHAAKWGQDFEIN